MSRQNLPFQTDIPVSFVAPEDVLNANPLDFTNDGATCSFKVFDAGKDEVLSGTPPSGDEYLVTNAGAFEVGDVVEVDLDDGSVFDAGAIVAVDPVAGTITVSNLLVGGTVSVDNRFRVRLGVEITMTEYGTAKLASRGYGFQGTLPWNHPGLDIGIEVDIEITFVGNPVGGLTCRHVICGVIRPREDCEECC